jgi:integrase
MSISQPIRNKHQIREISEYYLKLGQIRNYVLIVMGIHTALRIGDLLRLTWDDVYDFERGRIRESITVVEQKTGKTKIVLLNGRIALALSLYAYAAGRGRPLILSRKGRNKAISRQQAHRIISAAADALGFSHRVSCHSLRKTFGYLAWKSGVSPAVIMKIYNHSSLAVTQRYLGVTQDDLDDCYRKLAELA